MDSRVFACQTCVSSSTVNLHPSPKILDDVSVSPALKVGKKEIQKLQTGRVVALASAQQDDCGFDP